MKSVQSAGTAVRAGANAELVFDWMYSAATLLPGLRTRFKAASNVLFAAEAPPGVVAAKSCSHGVEVAAAVHVFSRFAMLSIFATGKTPFVGKAAPGEAPVVMFARLAAVAAAFASPERSSRMLQGWPLGQEIERAPRQFGSRDLIDDELVRCGDLAAGAYSCGQGDGCILGGSPHAAATGNKIKLRRCGRAGVGRRHRKGSVRIRGQRSAK